MRWSPWDPHSWAKNTKPRTGAGNAWSTISVDAQRDLVFVPTGSASPYYFGGIRKGDDQWANSVVALTRIDGAIRVGFSGGASRFVGLRRGVTTDAVHLER